MKIALAAGGTGGHMFPAQALAEAAKAQGHDVLLLTDERGDRYTSSFPCDQKVLLDAASPSARGLLAKVKAALALARGIGRAGKAFRTFGADVVIGFGGYPSAPSMIAAQRKAIPTGIHEQNAVLGRANRLAARNAGFIAHAFPVLEKAPKEVKLREIGNPVRSAVSEVAGTPYPTLEGPIELLIFGGSQGASLFAKHFTPAIAGLPQELRSRLRVTHQVVEADLEAATSAYRSAGIDAELAPFFSDLPERMAKSHLVVSRSGASSVAELSVIGRPSILVPLKIAMDDHQRMNARVLTDVNGARLILEDDLSAETARLALVELLSAPSHLNDMAAAAKGRMAEGAAGALLRLAEEIASARGPA